jgi:hypothetical protein
MAVVVGHGKHRPVIAMANARHISINTEFNPLEYGYGTRKIGF